MVLTYRHVKNLESRSTLLDTALSSADEANRRWEECRSLLEGLRAENGQLKAEAERLRAENAMLRASSGHGTDSGANGRGGAPGMDSMMRDDDDR
jgi:hypothetical protein